MITLPTFTDARARSIWVLGQLKLSGQSFASIARANGWTRRAVQNAMSAPSDPQERAIADALGVEQSALFPERYDECGRRLHHVRKDKLSVDAGTVKSDEAA